MFELTPEDQQKISNQISEVVNSMIRIESERDLIKDILADIKDKYKINSTVIRKVATYIISEEKKEKAEEEFNSVEFLLELSKK